MTFHIHSIADSVIIYGLGTTAVFVASVVVRKVFEYFTTVVCVIHILDEKGAMLWQNSPIETSEIIIVDIDIGEKMQYFSMK